MARLVLVGLIVSSLGACRSEQICTAGSVVACSCPGGGPGTKVCSPRGDSWGPCACPASAAGGKAPAPPQVKLAPSSAPQTQRQAAVPSSATRFSPAFDFRNGRLPIDDHSKPAVFKNGEARWTTWLAKVKQVVVADLDADGREEAVLLIGVACADMDECGNNWGAYVCVYAPKGAGAQLVTSEPFIGTASPQADALSVVDGKLVVKGGLYTADDAHCCPSQKHASTYVLKGRTLQLVNKVSSPAPGRQ
jgi:hypothetical protein